jgi:chemotaxis protein CheZ
MGTVIANKVTISCAEFLDSYVHLYSAIKDYDELITLVADDQSLESQDIKNMIQSRITHLDFGSVNVKAMELLGTYLKFTLDKFKGDKLTFLIPEEIDDDFFSLNDGYLDLSKSIQNVESELREIEERIYYLVRLLPPYNVDKISLLLKAISSFFKSIVRKDVDDINSHINHMHHLTASKESYLVINDIGKMVREIHNSLQDFSSHVQIEDFEPNIVDEMPDAIDKLNLVIKRMEESANSTLDSVELLQERNSDKLQNSTSVKSKFIAIEERLQAIKEKHPDTATEIDDILENLAPELNGELDNWTEQLKEEESIYFDIISNQSFQDITGQTLKKIIKFIEQLEFNLLQILQKYSGRIPGVNPVGAEAKKVSPLVGRETDDGLVLEGPQDNKEESKEVAKQDDVDKVLADFGF